MTDQPMVRIPKQRLRCFRCKQPITGPRIVKDGFYHCSSCIYAVEVKGEPRELPREALA